MYRRSGVFWKEARDGEPEENRWGVRFSAMFHMSNDSGLFRTREQLEQSGWRLQGNVYVKGDERYFPLYEGKLFHQYDHRFATFEDADERELSAGNAHNMTAEEKADPDSVVIPRYWVPAEAVNQRLGGLSTDGTSISPVGFGWFIVFRDTASPTNERTAISTAIPGVAVSNKAPLVNFEPSKLLQVFRSITKATDERTVLTDSFPKSRAGNRIPVITYERPTSVASALVLANLNSLPFDRAARFSVGGNATLNFFIVKQLPVLPPEVYTEKAPTGDTWVEMVVPRVLELTYTAWDLQPFAQDLGYDGPPFVWDEERRHRLKCELDAIYAHLYQLDREDLVWVLDAPEPSQSFPGLKQNEEQRFGEYRTQRYVLRAYDLLAQGQLPNLDD